MVFSRLTGRKSIKVVENRPTAIVQSAPVQRALSKPFLDIIDTADFAATQKALPFNQYVLDFINGTGAGAGNPYSEQQVLNAYLTSVYLFAALRRVRNLVSRVRIRAQQQQGNTYVSLPDASPLNRMFQREGGKLLARTWLNYAVYGSVVIFKTRTRKAELARRAGQPIYDWKDGAVAGLHVLDSTQWELDEDTYTGEIKGVNVNQFTQRLGDINYLERPEFCFFTDWNPENPNDGRSIVTVAIHDAVANASISRWMSEYFTRGAMPFLVVSMDEDPSLITDSDLRKYKRQFEEHWQGMDASLRASFFDRKLNVEQVGINAADVAAPDLNTTALEGISAAVGIDRELIVTPEGGSQERHEMLMMRAILDVIIPFANEVVEVLQQDLGLPPDIQLYADYDDFPELKADRDEKSGTEISIYESGLQTHGEARVKLKEEPLEPLQSFVKVGGEEMHLNQVNRLAQVPPSVVREYAGFLWDGNLAKRSEILLMLGRQLPQGERDGYRSELENGDDWITGLWEQDLLTRGQVLEMMSIQPPRRFIDGYRSEVEQATNRDFISQMWNDNLLTRNMVLRLLDLPPVPAHFDGYRMDIEADAEAESRYIDTVMQMWNDNLITRQQAAAMIGVAPYPDALHHGYRDDISSYSNQIQGLWNDNLITRRQALQKLGYNPETSIGHGYQTDIEQLATASTDRLSTQANLARELYSDGLFTRREARSLLGQPTESGDIDGYVGEVEKKTEAEFATDDGGSWRSLQDERRSYRSQTPFEGQLPPPPVAGLPPYPQQIKLPKSDEWSGYYGSLDELALETGVNLFDQRRQSSLPYDHLRPIGNIQPPVVNVRPTVTPPPAQEEPAEAIAPLAPVQLVEEPVKVVTRDPIDVDAIIEFLNKEILPPPVQRIGGGTLLEPRLPVSEIETTDTSSPAAYASVWFGYDGRFVRIQRQLQQAGVDAAWLPDGRFHITLAYMQVNETQLNAVITQYPRSLQPFEIEVTGLDTFVMPDQTVVILRVQSEHLERLRQPIIAALAAQGVKPEHYTQSAHWNPHITLGYLPPDTPLPAVNVKPFTIVATTVTFQRDGYETIQTFRFGVDHDEPDGTQQVWGRGDYEAQLTFIRQRRQLLRHQLQRWSRGGDPVQLPQRLRDAVEEMITTGLYPDVWDIADWATHQGFFDGNTYRHLTPAMLLVEANAQRTPRAGQADVAEELTTWRQVALKNLRKGQRFDTQFVPAHVADSVRAALEAVQEGDIEAIRTIFGQAVTQIRGAGVTDELYQQWETDAKQRGWL